jgi:hypothetical protein
MAKDIKVGQQGGKMRKQPKVQAKIGGLGLIQREIATKKIRQPPKKEKTPRPIKQGTARIQPKKPKGQQEVGIGETWIEKKASRKDGKKLRCVVVLVLAHGGISYVLTVSKVAFDAGDLCPPFVQEMGAFLTIWTKM